MRRSGSSVANAATNSGASASSPCRPSAPKRPLGLAEPVSSDRAGSGLTLALRALGTDCLLGVSEARELPCLDPLGCLQGPHAAFGRNHLARAGRLAEAFASLAMLVRCGHQSGLNRASATPWACLI